MCARLLDHIGAPVIRRARAWQAAGVPLLAASLLQIALLSLGPAALGVLAARRWGVWWGLWLFGAGCFLASQVVPAGARDASLEKMLATAVAPLTLKFLRLVNDKGRLAHLPAIVAAFDQQVQESYGRVEVDVFTAEPMDASALADVKSRLSAALGKEAIVHPYTEPGMLGGIKLRMGDRLIDGSVRSQLRQIRDQLNTHGAAALRSKFGQILDDNAPATEH